MIQSTPVRAIMGRDDAVFWPIVSDGRFTSPSGITRMVMVCSKDGEDDVIVDSAVVPAAYNFNYATVARGRSVSCIRWIPGLAIGEQFTASGRWKCRVFLYDADAAQGIDHGAFWLDVVFAELPVTGNLTAATGCSATAFGFVSNAIVVEYYYPYCTEVRGSFSGDLNSMLPSATQTLTLLVAQSLATGVFSVVIRGTFPGTSPVQSVFNNLTFIDKNGVPRMLTSASATYTPISSESAHWEWNLGTVTMADGDNYVLEFHE